MSTFPSFAEFWLDRFLAVAIMGFDYALVYAKTSTSFCGKTTDNKR